MNINVRVLSANARSQIAALQAQVRALEGELAKANAVSSSPGAIGSARSRKSLMAWGNQIQWTGRQIQYNFTLPILLAGAAATKFALDNEKAFTRVKKVYGDTADAAKQFNEEAGKAADAQYGVAKANKVFANELDALGGAFEALSNRYGVQQKEVLDTAGAWAAAGASGVALAKSTELSIKTAILGDMELEKATESLIAIQSQYSLSTEQLGLTLAELNAIENQTGISMQGLIDGFSRSAGVAREAGVDVRHLGAMLAALVPATGSAATAGNALKTIISRLMSPTKDSADVMKEFGVNTADAAWQSSTAVERLTILAGHMGDSLKKSADGGYELSDSQKQVVASVLGSRYQMNRFLVLMREMDSTTGYYQKALDSTSDRQKVFNQATKELNAVLESNPRRLQIMWTTLQNGLADAIQPMIPYIIYLAQSISKAVTWFSNLDPEVQKLTLAALVFLAALGPIIRYIGSLTTLIGAIITPIRLLASGMLTLGGVMARGWLKTMGWLVTGTKLLFEGMWTVLVWGSSTVWTIMLKYLKSFVTIYTGIWSAGHAVWKFITTTFWAFTVRTWALGFGALMTIAGRFSGIIATMKGIFVALSVLFSRQMFIPLVMAMGRLTTVIEFMWLGMWGSLKFMMVNAFYGMLSIMSLFRATFLAGWAGIYVGITSLSAWFYNLMLRGYVIFTGALQTIMTAGAKVTTAIWAAMQAGMALISRVSLAGILRLWAAFALGIPRLLAILSGGVQTAFLNSAL